jgi:hypothetical protein
MTTPDVPQAPRSDVLCSAWASPADIPERHRPLLSNEEWERVLMQASEILWALSGRRWFGGGCEDTATLRSVPPVPGRGSWPYEDSWGKCACWSYGTWHGGWLFPAPAGAAQHYAPMAVRLPEAPVTGVTSVTINGEPFSDYRLTRSGWLERLDGNTWSVCDDSTQVVYTFGESPPEGGVQAAVALAVQLAMDEVGSEECQLPQRVTSVTRQGVSMTVLDPQEFLTNGRVGLYVVDLWLSAVNPQSRGQRGSVWSPDLPVTTRR